MNTDSRNKQKILIADDSEMNRSILADMLGDEYEIMEAENGVQAVSILQKHEQEIALILLDIVMPELDGFGVLAVMNKRGWIQEIPVIMISAESASSHVERAYDMGITDFITRPFDALIVHRRVVNTILLYAKQKKLQSLVTEQIYEKEQRSGLMIDILSHIVEFRNGESGLHVLHIHVLTDLLLQCLVQKTDVYKLNRSTISLISTASALHDIGKIAISGDILNKPGKLTREEFEIMKTHSEIGARMLKDLPIHQGEPLIRTAYEICRWHHERYDGGGYPDGLKGDEIPISAQIVALADVYDALTSERVYKKAYSHEKAVKMILEGECGVFNPLLLECLTDIADSIEMEMERNSYARAEEKRIQDIAEEMMKHEELTASERTLQLLEHERMKYSFFAAMSNEIQFEYTQSPSMVTLSAWGARTLELDEIIMEPLNNEKVIGLLGPEGIRELSDVVRSTVPEQPVVQYDCKMHLNGEDRWSRIICRATWSADEPPRYLGAIGKSIDIHEDRIRMDDLERMASHDMLTGLFNHSYARKRIMERMQKRPGGKFAMAIIDLDHFKSANDNHGHMFGDQVLVYMAERLRQSIRGGDIAARVGGDEFLIFLEYKEEIITGLNRIFAALMGEYNHFSISVSMGVALTRDVEKDYDALFRAADQALYEAKRAGRGQFCFYSGFTQEKFSVISPIDGEGEHRRE